MNTELNYFLQTTSNGISLGSMYSMIAVGYSMVYSLLYQVNFAHGDLYVFLVPLLRFLSLTWRSRSRWPFWPPVC